VAREQRAAPDTTDIPPSSAGTMDTPSTEGKWFADDPIIAICNLRHNASAIEHFVKRTEDAAPVPASSPTDAFPAKESYRV
jgi:hypothetical protein